MIEITDHITTLESNNVDSIYIWLINQYSPIVYEQSAVYLHTYFPEFPIVSILCSDNKNHKVIKDFPLERVTERFMDYHLLVDNSYIHIMNIKTVSQ